MKKNNWLHDYKKNNTSQCGEDGILEKIFEVLDVQQGWFVDVGCAAKHNSNTYSLAMKGWKGVCVDKEIDFLKSLYYDYKGKGISLRCLKIGVQDSDFLLDNLLYISETPEKFDLLSIDIDGNDWYVWESLMDYQPAVVVIEFNPCCKTEDYRQTIDGKGGSSISEMIQLGKEKRYELIATTDFNAFFIRQDLFHKFEILDNSLQELYTPTTKSYGRDIKNYARSSNNNI